MPLSLRGLSLRSISQLPIPPTTAASASAKPPAAGIPHVLLIIAISLALAAPKGRAGEVLILSGLARLSCGGAGTLHAGKHGRHGRTVQLAGVYARRYHLLQHGLHLGRGRRPSQAW